MVLRTREQVVAKPVDAAVKTDIAWLIDRHDGAPNFELRKFTIKPGGRIPRHYHHDIEHEQYVLTGDYQVGIGDEVHRVKEGDSLYIPAGTIHWYENRGKKNAEFLCIVPRKEQYDAVYLEEAVASSPKPKVRGSGRQRKDSRLTQQQLRHLGSRPVT